MATLFPVGDLPPCLAEGALVLVGKGIGKIEELGDGVGPDDPRLFEDGVVDRLRPGEGAGVRGGRLGAGARPSRFDDDHRCGTVAGGDLLYRLDEFLPLPELLEVEDDDRRIEVVVEVEEQVELVDVRLVADGDELREAEIPIRGKIEDRGAERPALGDERNVSAGGHPPGEARVQADSGRGLITPRQLGPTRRTLAALQRETIRFSISSPFPPTSRKPAETITIPLTPFSIASSTALMGAPAAG